MPPRHLVPVPGRSPDHTAVVSPIDAAARERSRRRHPSVASTIRGMGELLDVDAALNGLVALGASSVSVALARPGRFGHGLVVVRWIGQDGAVQSVEGLTVGAALRRAERALRGPIRGDDGDGAA